MAPLLKVLIAAAAALIVLRFTPPAFAHHVMGGELPSTAWRGLLSGLGHPIIGIDHFAFTVGVGLMSHLAGRIVLLPLLFVAGSVLGCIIHTQASIFCGQSRPSGSPSQRPQRLLLRVPEFRSSY